MNILRSPNQKPKPTTEAQRSKATTKSRIHRGGAETLRKAKQTFLPLMNADECGSKPFVPRINANAREFKWGKEKAIKICAENEENLKLVLRRTLRRSKNLFTADLRGSTLIKSLQQQKNVRSMGRISQGNKEVTVRYSP